MTRFGGVCGKRFGAFCFTVCFGFAFGGAGGFTISGFGFDFGATFWGRISASGSGALIFGSIFEGFGIPILEALNCGIPVITSKDGCFEEAGGKYSSYVDPLDIEELADSMDNCLTFSKKREKMIIQGLKHAKRFEPEVISRELMNAYQELLY